MKSKATKKVMVEVKSTAFSFKGINWESIAQYAISIAATLVLGHITELTNLIAQYVNIEVAAGIMALVAIVLKKFVLPTPTVPSKE